MKILMVFLSSIIFLSSFPLLGLAQPINPNKEQNDAILTVLSPSISTAITGYYGTPRQFGLYDADILSLTRMEEGRYSFRVKVLVKTFVGAHNPPYGNEIITLTIDPSGVHVEEFIHHEG
ncbi:DUF3888 domain-containing protein [Paenibacillus macerans]|uniref:DUF3888 domain-containing protein n=1 Tax=Paenibacillus macerans TaxID=44252 RepID=UPI0022E939A7|nr:DUF3888 domain-containing protein [Paenibacillus macerans]